MLKALICGTFSLGYKPFDKRSLWKLSSFCELQSSIEHVGLNLLSKFLSESLLALFLNTWFRLLSVSNSSSESTSSVTRAATIHLLYDTILLGLNMTKPVLDFLTKRDSNQSHIPTCEQQRHWSRLHGCTGWSAPLLFANPKEVFSRFKAHRLYMIYIHVGPVKGKSDYFHIRSLKRKFWASHLDGSFDPQ